MARPATTRAKVRQFLLKHPGQPFTIPEICEELGLDSRADHNTVRRGLLYLGCVKDGTFMPRSTTGRGGRRKPINLWIRHENQTTDNGDGQKASKGKPVGDDQVPVLRRQTGL